MSQSPPPTPIEDLIRDFIAREIMFSPDGFPYPDDASFLQESIVDSLGVMHLVEFVERQYGVQVPQGDVIPQNFDSVTNLAAYIRRKNGLPTA